MRWADLDFKAGIWTIPAGSMKSGKLHEVPLSAMARNVIKGMPRQGEYVFGVGSEGKRPYRGASNGMDGLRRQLLGEEWREDDKLTPWRLHDARRTAVTLAQRGGASVEEIRALTQHKTPGVIGVYARHSYADEKRRVVETIGRQIRAILKRRGG
jgi:integrase